MAAPVDKQGEKGIWLDEGCAVHPLAELAGPVYIGRNACLRRGTRIGEGTIICEGCIVGEDVEISGSLLRPNVRVGSGAKITDSIIDANCVVGRDVIMEKDVVVGKECDLGDESIFLSGARVRPHTTVRKADIIRSETTQRAAK